MVILLPNPAMDSQLEDEVGELGTHQGCLRSL